MLPPDRRGAKSFLSLRHNLGVIWAKDALSDRKGSLLVNLGCIQLAPVPKDDAEIVKGACDFPVVLEQDHLLDCECCFPEPLHEPVVRRLEERLAALARPQAPGMGPVKDPPSSPGTLQHALDCRPRPGGAARRRHAARVQGGDLRQRPRPSRLYLADDRPSSTTGR
jgi:hypothetical protein